MKGLIVAITCGLYAIEAEGVIYKCKPRGIFRNQGIKPVVGDNIEFDPNELVIENVYPRSSFLKRPLIANISQIILVFSLKEPDFSYLLAFKYLTYANMHNIKAKLVITKIDKEHDEKLASLMRFVSDTPRTYSYPLPNDSMLAEVDDSAKMAINTESAQEKATIINRVFDEFDVHAKATTFTIGASVTRFNIETEHGEKADKIASLTSEFQRALNGDMSVRVETVVEGRSTSGIEVGNKAPMAVSFKDVFSQIEQNTKDPLLLPIGKDISGNIVSSDRSRDPAGLSAQCDRAFAFC